MKPISPSITSLSGPDPVVTEPLCILEAVRSGAMPGSSMGSTIPMVITYVAVGEVHLRVAPDARHHNPARGIHGGFAATCLDSAAALALYSGLGAGDSYATIDLGVKYIRPLAEGEHYTAVGHLVERTKRLGVCTARIVDAAGKCYAIASASFMVSSRAKEYRDA